MALEIIRAGTGQSMLHSDDGIAVFRRHMYSSIVCDIFWPAGLTYALGESASEAYRHCTYGLLHSIERSGDFSAWLIFCFHTD